MGNFEEKDLSVSEPHSTNVFQDSYALVVRLLWYFLLFKSYLYWSTTSWCWRTIWDSFAINN